MRKLPLSFFERKTLVVTKDLLGKYLVRKIGNRVIREKITEVEAYVGPYDLACHSSRGKTERNKVMFEKAGTIYVYFTYGMHWMLNIVTEKKDYPAAILIRGTEHYKGPAILTKNLKIDKSLNGQKLGTKSGLWIEEDVSCDTMIYHSVSKKLRIERSPRVGINFAPEPWRSKKYRFKLYS